jgi:hypothetical protein
MMARSPNTPRHREPRAERSAAEARSAAPRPREREAPPERPNRPQPPPPSAPDARYLLLVIGLCLGGVAAVCWELSVDEMTPKKAAAASRADEPEKSGKQAGSRTATRTARETPKPQRPTPAPAASVATDHVQASPAHDEAVPERTGPLTTSSTPRRQRTRPPPRVAPDELCVDRVLVGGELITAGLLAESAVDQEQDHSKYFVCFDLSWSDEPRAVMPAKCEDFRVEDAKGESYEPICDLRGLRPAARTKGRGCIRVVFAVFNDSAPERLLYRNAEGKFVPLPDQSR